MSDVQAALHLHRQENIDTGQIAEFVRFIWPYTLVECRAFSFLRFVNVQ
ncbi:MAG: hypothetical protein ACOVQ0_11240 [Novosphingobium sp.]